MPPSRPSGHVHRRSEIVAFVKSRGGARIDELADRFGVSTMTIHRDLDHLDAQGMLRKVRSGAEAPPSEAFERNVEMRRALNVTEKHAVARAGYRVGRRAGRHAGRRRRRQHHRPARAARPARAPAADRRDQLPARHQRTGHRSRGPAQRRSAATTCPTSRPSSARSRSARCATCTTTSCSCRCPPCPAGCASTRRAPPPTSSAPSWKAPSCSVLLVDHTKFTRRAIHRICDLEDFDAVVVDDGLDARRRATTRGRRRQRRRRAAPVRTRHRRSTRCCTMTHHSSSPSTARRRRPRPSSSTAPDTSSAPAPTPSTPPARHRTGSSSTPPTGGRPPISAMRQALTARRRPRRRRRDLRDPPARELRLPRRRRASPCGRRSCGWTAAPHAEARRYGTDRVELLSGKPADITPGLYKLLWLRDHEPETLARCAHVADVHTYLVHAMTGRWTSSTASVDPLALLDQATGDYADELLELAGLRRDQLPDLVPTGTSLGPLRAEVADAWGVDRDVVGDRRHRRRSSRRDRARRHRSRQRLPRARHRRGDRQRDHRRTCRRGPTGR